ncbi:MAG: dienelactone hydrolase family protein [Leptospiraceae bacterium]
MRTSRKVTITGLTGALMALHLFSVGCQKEPLVEGTDLEYEQDGKPYLGYLAVDKNQEGKRPGILLIHEWTGLGDYVKRRADQLAAMGYTVFAMDMYGEGIRASNHDEAAELMTQYNEDRPTMRARMDRAMEVLKEQGTVDGDRIAVIGYCFGGGAAIEYALSGGEVDAIVSFHGMLASPNLEKDVENIKASIQIHHGSDDGFVPSEVVNNLKSNLEKAGVDFKFFSYLGAVHGFTRASAGNDKESGIAYNKEADEKSWERMTEFLDSELK